MFWFKTLMWDWWRGEQLIRQFIDQQKINQIMIMFICWELLDERIWSFYESYLTLNLIFWSDETRSQTDKMIDWWRNCFIAALINNHIFIFQDENLMKMRFVSQRWRANDHMFVYFIKLLYNYILYNCFNGFKQSGG